MNKIEIGKDDLEFDLIELDNNYLLNKKKNYEKKLKDQLLEKTLEITLLGEHNE